MDSRIAVVAILLFEEKCLFLNRSHPPLLWGPPCGRLKEGEDVVAGLKREVFEETGLTAEPILPVEVWQGLHQGASILSIAYTCLATSSKVHLSSEHSDFLWVPVQELNSTDLKTDFDLKKWPLYIRLTQYFQKENP